MRSGRRAVSSSNARNIIATRIGWLWGFWASNGNLTRLEDIAGLDTLLKHSEAAQREAPSSEIDSQLACIRAARDIFDPIARTFQEQRVRPRLSDGEDFVLGQLRKYLGNCVLSRRGVVESMLAWVRSGTAHVILSREGRRWHKLQFTPEMVFEQASILYTRYPPNFEDLGEAVVVVSCFGEPTEC